MELYSRSESENLKLFFNYSLATSIPMFKYISLIPLNTIL